MTRPTQWIGRDCIDDKKRKKQKNQRRRITKC